MPIVSFEKHPEPEVSSFTIHY